MRAYKVLSDGRSEFTGVPWPLPADGQPGEWVLANGALGLCTNGIHASTVDQLPQWLGDEIWEAELDGEVLETEPALVASRARLVRRVDAWDEEARLGFSHDCAQRARQLAARYPAGAEIFTVKIEPFAERGMAAAVGYWTVLLSAESATRPSRRTRLRRGVRTGARRAGRLAARDASARGLITQAASRPLAYGTHRPAIP